MAQKGVTVARTDFPLYTIRMIGDRHFLIAGGGGQAKTGIANAIEIYELKHENTSCIAKKVNHYETGSEAIMNCSAMEEDKSFTIATGQNGNCQLYNLHFKVVVHKDGQEGNDNQHGLRKRKGNHTKSENYKSAPKTVMFEIEKSSSVQTDFHKDGPFQKVSVFTQKKDLLLTAGADGFIRIWQIPDVKKVQEINAHKNEIDDIDVHPLGNKVVSVSKDNHAFVWTVKNGKRHCELKWTRKTEVPYRFRNCRFGIVIDKEDTYNLYTTHIPSTRGGRSSPRCFLTKWSTVDYTPSKIQDVGTETLSAMALSSDGVYVGLGTITGSVSVYVSFSLQKLYYLKEAHNIFVTGLDFAPQKSSTLAITGNHDFTLFSISADNQVKIHQEACRGSYSIVWVIVAVAIIIYFIFWMIATTGV